MAFRTLFASDLEVNCSNYFHNQFQIEFPWEKGYSPQARKKNSDNLRFAIARTYDAEQHLEVSTSSNIAIGQQLSALNLSIKVNDVSISLESAYQASKIFEFGGPYTDLLDVIGLIAKRDYRLKESGSLKGFDSHGSVWPVTVNPSYYDLLYISFLTNIHNHDLANEVLKYRLFTDINYSQTGLGLKQGISYNCQAKSLAIYVSGKISGLNDDEILSKIKYSILAKSEPTLF